MPELPEVETSVASLRPWLEGALLLGVEVRRPDLRWPLPPGLAALAGRRVTGLDRRGKWGAIHLDGAEPATLLFHLGMSGRWRLLDGAPGPHDHVVLQGERAALALHDPRRFGALELAPRRGWRRHPRLARLGPEPLSRAFSAAVLARAARGRHSSVRALLLDQRVVAGLGNIYVAEALFAAGLAPDRAAASLQPAECARLARAVRRVLRAGIAAGGATLRDHGRPDGTPGHFQHAFAVYGRAGQPCRRCGTAVAMARQAGRSSFHCPRCQPRAPATRP